MRRVVKNQVFQSRVINELRRAGRPICHITRVIIPIINVWHTTVYGTGRSVIVVYASKFQIVMSVTIPTFVDLPLPRCRKEYGCIQDLVMPTNWTNVQWKGICHRLSVRWEWGVLRLYIVGYGDSDAYSTQNFCVKWRIWMSKHIVNVSM